MPSTTKKNVPLKQPRLTSTSNVKKSVTVAATSSSSTTVVRTKTSVKKSDAKTSLKTVTTTAAKQKPLPNTTNFKGKKSESLNQKNDINFDPESLVRPLLL